MVTFVNGRLNVSSIEELELLQSVLANKIHKYVSKKDKTVSKCKVVFTQDTVRLEIYKNMLVIDIYRDSKGDITNEIKFLNSERGRANKIKVQEQAQWNNILKLLKSDMESTADVLNLSGQFISELIKLATKESKGSK